MANRRKSHARRKTTRKSSVPSASTIWSVLLTGIVVGLFIAFGVYVYTSGKYQTMGDGLGKLYSNIAEPGAPQQPEIKQQVTHLEPSFDYHKILLKNERPIPRFEAEALGRIKPKNSDTQQNTETTQEAEATSSVYMLQVGAFREHKDAENLKARLAFSGLVANIQTVSLPVKGIFHRVRLGPFRTIAAMNQADTKLAQQGINAARMQISQ